MNDAAQQVFRQQTARDFTDLIVDQFDEMVERSADRPMVCCLSIHPYIVGQPYRIRALRSAFKHIVGHPLRDRVWFTRGDAIADYCRSLPPGLIP